MDIYIKNLKDTDFTCDAIILPVIEGEAGFYNYLGKSVSNILRKVLLKEFCNQQNELILVPAPDDIKPERLLFVYLGKKDLVSSEKLRQAGGKSAAYLRDMGMKRIALSTSLVSDLRLSPAEFIEGMLLRLYTFDKFKKVNNKRFLERTTILSKPAKELTKKLEWVRTVTSSVCFARDLINAPANHMTPDDLAKTALSLRQKNLTVKVLGRKDAHKLGMGAYLSVANGSKEPPKFIVLQYKGARGAPLVLIGKSITFDSGGISLKPAEGMEKMKYDMAGGAVVLGVIKAAAELRMPLSITGILPATENLPGGSASKPGDVVTAINGKTIEIVNTDAEGRLVVADAIGYAQRFKPQAIIDIATLTGACSIALGDVAIAIMGNDRGLIDKIRKSSDETCERVWEMPLFEEYREYIRGDITDIKNTGGKNGSLVTSAFFLYEFAGNVPWVHFDIAGTAWTEKDKPYIPKGASGIGVRLILNLIKELK